MKSLYDHIHPYSGMHPVALVYNPPNILLFLLYPRVSGGAMSTQPFSVLSLHRHFSLSLLWLNFQNHKSFTRLMIN